MIYNVTQDLRLQGEREKKKVNTVGSRFAAVLFMMIHFYDPCQVRPDTPNLWCIIVATQASFLYLVHL